MDSISFDGSLEDYEAAAEALCDRISYHYGLAEARRIFLKQVPSKRHIKIEKNIWLMVAYTLRGLSVRQCAIKLAEENKLVPRDQRRYGGTTNAKTMEKQIRREKKRMSGDQSYRKEVGWHVECANDLKAGTTDV